MSGLLSHSKNSIPVWFRLFWWAEELYALSYALLPEWDNNNGGCSGSCVNTKINVGLIPMRCYSNFKARGLQTPKEVSNQFKLPTFLIVIIKRCQ